MFQLLYGEVGVKIISIIFRRLEALASTLDGGGWGEGGVNGGLLFIKHLSCALLIFDILWYCEIYHQS